VSWLKDLMVGEDVFIRSNDNREASFMARVTHKGRTLITFQRIGDDGRLHLFDFKADMTQRGLYPVTRVDWGRGANIYKSAADYDRYVHQQKMISAISDALSLYRSEDHSYENILAAAQALGIDTEKLK
jgi:hypothetical protein